MSINVQEFFRRLVDELGWSVNQKIEDVFVQFNGDTEIQLLRFLGDEHYEYRFIPIRNDKKSKWYTKEGNTRLYRVTKIRSAKGSSKVFGGGGKSLHISLEEVDR